MTLSIQQPTLAINAYFDLEEMANSFPGYDGDPCNLRLYIEAAVRNDDDSLEITESLQDELAFMQGRRFSPCASPYSDRLAVVEEHLRNLLWQHTLSVADGRPLSLHEGWNGVVSHVQRQGNLMEIQSRLRRGEYAAALRKSQLTLQAVKRILAYCVVHASGMFNEVREKRAAAYIDPSFAEDLCD